MTRPTPLLLVAANPSGIKVRAVRSDTTYQVPPEVQNSAAYQKGLRRVLDRVARGIAFDGLMQPAVRIDVIGEEFILHCQETRYSYACAISEVAKERYAAGDVPGLFPLEKAPPAASGIDTALITSDSKVLLSLRSSSMGKWPNCWAVGFGEGLEPQDLGSDNLFFASSRCLAEELGLHLPSSSEIQSRYTALMLARENDSYTWNTYALLDLRGLDVALYSAEAILGAAMSAKDGWESTRIVPMAALEVPAFLADKELVPSAEMFYRLISQYLALNPSR